MTQSNCPLRPVIRKLGWELGWANHYASQQNGIDLGLEVPTCPMRGNTGMAKAKMRERA